MVLRFGAMPAGDEPLVIAGMFTPSHIHTAERLVRSLRNLKLPHVIYEVPTIHRSISRKGSDDPVYAKSNFIWHVRELARRPVLYLDVDTVFRRSPKLIFELLQGGCDFAILNWMAQDNNDAYVPVPVTPAAGKKPPERRFFQFSHHINLSAQDQLICSGAAQLWGRSDAATALLSGWFETIVAQPGVPDDHCLDFAFNNRVGGWDGTLRPAWLPKSYARYAWWIFDEPVIDHPDFPADASGWAEIADPAGRLRLYTERATIRNVPPRIPRDCIIDTETGEVLRLQNQKYARIGRIAQKLWLPRS
jgi:hypothetical protein